MKITDINGNEIIVADLHSAKLHADEFVERLQSDELFKQADSHIKKYWLDIQAKLEKQYSGNN